LTAPGSMREHCRSKRLSRRRGGKLRLQSSRSLAKRCGRNSSRTHGAEEHTERHDFSAPQTPLSKKRTYRYMTSAPGSGNSEMRIYLTSVPGTVAGFQANFGFLLTSNDTAVRSTSSRKKPCNRVPLASCFCRRRSSPADVRGVQKDFRDVPGLKPHTGIPPHIFFI